MTDSHATGLRCIDCGKDYPLGYRLQCDACAGLLELQYDLERLRASGPSVLSGAGLWRYAAVLPIADPAHRITLGEGQSPLLECRALGQRLGVKRLLAKFEEIAFEVSTEEWKLGIEAAPEINFSAAATAAFSPRADAAPMIA